MIPCNSAYYGMVKIWNCRLLAGHDGPHESSKALLHQTEYEAGYCSWDDNDCIASLLNYIDRGGNK